MFSLHMSRCKSRKIKRCIIGNCTCDGVKGGFTCICSVWHNPEFITFYGRPALATNQVRFVIQSIVIETQLEMESKYMQCSLQWGDLHGLFAEVETIHCTFLVSRKR